MADYFPLISRAVTALDSNGTRAQREAIYDRARDALLRQLRGIEPALEETDIAREKLQLENAVTRLETQLAQAAADALNPEPEPLPTKSEAAFSAEVDAAVPADRLAPTLSNDELLPRRPRVPFAGSATDAARKKSNIGIILAAGLPIILGVAVAAYILRDNPADFTKAKSVIAAQNAAAVSDSKAGASGAPSGEASAQAPATAIPAIPAEPILPVAVRASLYEETPGNLQQRREQRGAITWRLEPDTVEQGQPNASRIKGDIELPNANLNVEFIFRRNLDPTIPASHTFNLRFIPSVSPIAAAQGVKSIELPEFREDSLQKGPTLQSVKISLQENAFLVALLNGEPVQSINIELLKRPGWLYFELRLADGRRAELVFEKGVAGERAFNQAFASWGQ